MSKKKISGMGLFIILIVGIVIVLQIFSFIGEKVEQREARKEEQLAEQIKQRQLENTKIQSKEFLGSIEQHYEHFVQASNQDDYTVLEKVYNQFKRFEKVNPDVLEFMKENEMESVFRVAKIAELDGLVRKVPASEYETNLKLYKQLVSLDPDNKHYAERVSHYTSRIEEQKRKARQAEEREKRIKSQFSAWNGAHLNLERVIKNSMHNPKSFKHVETVYWDMGGHLIVKTTFRGTNAFGAVMTNSARAKVSLDGKVLEILN